MIELQMVLRMIRKGFFAAPILAVVLFVAGDLPWAVSGLIGLTLTLANLWFAGRVLGGVAENDPQALTGAAFAVFGVGLIGLTVAAIGLKQIDYIVFPVTGITLVVSHIVLVTWEAAGSMLKLPQQAESKELVHGP